MGTGAVIPSTPSLRESVASEPEYLSYVSVGKVDYGTTVATAYLMTGLLSARARGDMSERSSGVAVAGDRAASKTCVLYVLSRCVRKATAATDTSENVESLTSYRKYKKGDYTCNIEVKVALHEQVFPITL